MADNTKKETKLTTIEEDGEQLLDNVTGGMMINEGDKQDQTFGDYMNKRTLIRRVLTTNKMRMRSTLLLVTLTKMMMISEEINFSSLSTIIIFYYSATY